MHYYVAAQNLYIWRVFRLNGWDVVQQMQSCLGQPLLVHLGFVHYVVEHLRHLHADVQVVVELQQFLERDEEIRNAQLEI